MEVDNCVSRMRLQCLPTILFFPFKNKGYIDREGAVSALALLQHLLHCIDERQDRPLQPG